MTSSAKDPLPPGNQAGGDRRELTYAVSRRHLFPALVREAMVTLDLARGGRAGRLADLDALPDEDLFAIKPVSNPAFEILIEGEEVWARHRESGKQLHLFALGEEERLLLFNMFDGRHTLGQAAAGLVRQQGLEEDLASARTRSFFLELARNLVFVPKDPPADGMDSRL